MRFGGCGARVGTDLNISALLAYLTTLISGGLDYKRPRNPLCEVASLNKIDLSGAFCFQVPKPRVPERSTCPDSSYFSGNKHLFLRSCPRLLGPLRLFPFSPFNPRDVCRRKKQRSQFSSSCTQRAEDQNFRGPGWAFCLHTPKSSICLNLIEKTCFQ